MVPGDIEEFVVNVEIELTITGTNRTATISFDSQSINSIGEIEILGGDDEYLSALKTLCVPMLYSMNDNDLVQGNDCNEVYFTASGIRVKEDKTWSGIQLLYPIYSDEDNTIFAPLYVYSYDKEYMECAEGEDNICDYYGMIPLTLNLESNYINTIKETDGTFNADILHMKDSRGNEAPYDFVHTKINNKFTFSAANGEENSANCRNNVIGGVGTKQSNVFFVGNVNNNTVLPGAENVTIKSSGNFIGPGNHNNKEIRADYTVLLNGMVTSV